MNVNVELDHVLPEVLDVGKGTYLIVEGVCRSKSVLPNALWLKLNKGSLSNSVSNSVTRASIINSRAQSKTEEITIQHRFRFEHLLLPVLDAYTASLSIDVIFEDGRFENHQIGNIRLSPSPGLHNRPNLYKRDGNITICMATFNPAKDQFIKQIESIRSQTYQDWHCIIVDDHSSAQSLTMIEGVIGQDHRFDLIKHESNVGFYYNFERALNYVPPDSEYVALSDQDDLWDDDKLELLVSKMSVSVNLTYSDQRIINDDDITLSNTYWSNRKNNYTNLGLMMLANTVTGAASLFKTSMLKDILPFPHKIGDAFHDHWIACVALSTGEIEYIDRPLYSYRQHDNSVIGHCDFSKVSVIERLKKSLKILWRGIISGGYIRNIRKLRNTALAVEEYECRRLSLMSELLLYRCQQDIIKNKRRSLSMYKRSPLSGIKLLLWHFIIIVRGDTTDDAEIRLASGYLIGPLNRVVTKAILGMRGVLRPEGPQLNA